MAKLARALNVDSLADVDLRQLAKKVRAQGRGRDTVLAHITPQEARLLKRRGGRGSINPKTGLPEFEDDFYDFGGGDYGGDYGGGDGGGDTNVVYEYYDQPAQDATGSYEQPAAVPDATGSYEFPTESVPGSGPAAAQDPNVQLLSATQGQTAATDDFPTDADGNPIVPPDSDEAGVATARAAFDARNAETARIADLADTDPERMRYEADIATRATQEPDFLSRLSSSLGLGNLGLGGNGIGGLLGNAALMRLLAAGGATAAAVRGGNQAQNQANDAANQIRNIAQDPIAAANTAQTQLAGLADNTRAAANTAQTQLGGLADNTRAATNTVQAGIANLATDQQKRVDTAVAQIQQLADTANLRAVDVQKGLATIATNTGLRAADIQAQYNKIANPYQTQGAELARMGLSGGLTPAMAQAFQAAEARLAQQGIGRGGVAAAQSANQLEALRGQLLGEEYKQGLATQQIGDRYAQQGIAASTAQANLADQLNNQALMAGLNQYNYANTLGVSGGTTGLAGSSAANALAASGIQTGLTGNAQANALAQSGIQTGLTSNAQANALAQSGINAALQAAGIRDQYLIQALQTGLQGNAQARTAMQNLFTQIGGFLGGGTGGGNTATTTART
jgi:hypothetical protein